VSKILKVKARQVFDSRGNPTVEAEVYIKNNSASAICPSGASTGTFEAFEKRDKNNKRYLGKSVLNVVNLVNTKISKKLKGQSIHNQERIDELLINLDGTRQKTNLKNFLQKQKNYLYIKLFFKKIIFNYHIH
jgi:enolase